MPGGAGRQLDGEAEPAVGVDCRRAGVARRQPQRAGEILVVVGGDQRLGLLRPFGDDAAAADDAIGLHLEHIREIAADGDFQVEADRLHAVVGEVEILMHPVGQDARDGEAEGARQHRTVLAEKLPVGKKQPRGVMRDRRTIQHIPLGAVGEHVPGADHAGVADIQAHVARPVDLAIRLGDQDAEAMVDRDLRRADGNLEGQVAHSCARRVAQAGRGGARKPRACLPLRGDDSRRGRQADEQRVRGVTWHSIYAAVAYRLLHAAPMHVLLAACRTRRRSSSSSSGAGSGNASSS